MRAFCDLSQRKTQGAQVDTKNIKKHKNDVLKIEKIVRHSMMHRRIDGIRQTRQQVDEDLLWSLV